MQSYPFYSYKKFVPRDFIRKTKLELGLEKKKPKYEITRTALLAYKELHGVEYQLPENAIVIED